MIHETENPEPLEIEYEILPGQKGTYYDPEFLPEVEISEIYKNKMPVDTKRYRGLIDQYFDMWAKEILTQEPDYE